MKKKDEDEFWSVIKKKWWKKISSNLLFAVRLQAATSQIVNSDTVHTFPIVLLLFEWTFAILQFAYLQLKRLYNGNLVC